MVQYGFGVLKAFQLGAFWVFNKKIDENNGPPSSVMFLNTIKVLDDIWQNMQY